MIIHKINFAFRKFGGMIPIPIPIPIFLPFFTFLLLVDDDEIVLYTICQILSTSIEFIINMSFI